MTERLDKFTEHARKVLQLAHDEALRFNHSYLGTEHILLGLVRETEGIAARVLADLGLNVEDVRAAVEAITNHQESRMGQVNEISLTEEARGAIQAAVEEARQLDHHYIGTEHLLLGIIRDGRGIAVEVVKSFQQSPDAVRAAILDALPSADVISPSGHQSLMGKIRQHIHLGRQVGVPLGSSSDEEKGQGSDRFSTFTDRARRVLSLAQEEAQRFNHNYIGTEHILLGLVREGDGVAARVLNNLGIELHKVRAAVEFIIGRGDRMLMGDIGLTPRAKRVIELAVDEARRLDHHYLGTEHLLLGLVREGEGIAAGVLESLGVSLEKVRAEVLEVLKSSEGYMAGGPGGAAQQSTSTGRYVALDQVRTMFDYSLWARDKLLDVVRALEEAHLKAGEHKGVYGSIHDTLAHLAVSEWLWISRCLGESPMNLPKGEDFADLAALVEWWDNVHAQAIEYLSKIDEAHLNWPITYTAPDGKTRTRKIWHMLLQVTNHQTEHRAQIATMLGQMGVEVPQTDLVVYLSEIG